MKKEIRKSELHAEGLYDYKRLEYPREGFLACKIEERDETLEFTYEIEGYYPFSEIRNADRRERFRILLDVAKLERLREEYAFSMNPENLYFDENYRVFVRERDIEVFEEEEKTDFLQEYKSLAGYSLQKRYDYADYLEGGMGLLSKNQLLKKLATVETTGEAVNLFQEEYRKATEEQREKKQLVNRSAYRSSRIYIAVSFLLLCAGAAGILYDRLYERPELQAKLQAETDFVKGDYIRVIDDLEKLSLKRLSYDQKYILSVAYVNTENLTAEQKSNILEQLPINGEEKLMDYWIQIGRLNPLEAENIAMQRADDELLLYAYLLEKKLTEADTEITGEEKSEKLKELEGKIKELAENY